MKIPLKFSRAKWRCKSSANAAAGAESRRTLCLLGRLVLRYFPFSPGEKNLSTERKEEVMEEGTLFTFAEEF